MKKILFAMAGFAALATACGTAQAVDPPTGATQPTLKIGYINITKVIKEFKKANVLGDKILADATRYETELKGDQENLKKEELRIKDATLKEDEKEAIKKNFYKLQISLRDKDEAYQKDIRKRRDDMAIEVNSNIQRIIDSLAKYHHLELILTCPDVADAKEVGSLSDAMRRMTAPAVWVAYKDAGLDLTEECVTWVNHHFKAPGGDAPAAPAGGNK